MRSHRLKLYLQFTRPIVTIKSLSRSKAQEHTAKGKQQFGVLVNEMMPKVGEAFVAEANRLPRPCAFDQMDNSLGSEQVRVLPVEAVSHGTKAII